MLLSQHPKFLWTSYICRHDISHNNDKFWKAIKLGNFFLQYRPYTWPLTKIFDMNADA